MRTRIFQWLVTAIENNRRLTAGLVALSLAASVYLIVTQLGLNTSRDSIADPDDPEQALQDTFIDRFGAGTDLIVVLEAEESQVLRAAANSVAVELRKEEMVEQVFYRVDTDSLAHNGLYYLPTHQLESARRNMAFMVKAMGEADNPAVREIDGIAPAAATLNGLIDEFVEGDTSGFGDVSPSARDVDESIEFVIGLVTEMTRWLEDGQRKKLSLQARFARKQGGLTLDDDGYVVTTDGKLMMMRVRSRYDLGDEKFAIPLLATVRRIVGEHAGDATWGVTGVPALIAEERSSLMRDMKFTGLLSLFGCLLIFLVAFRSFRGTLAVFIPLAIGMAWAMAWTALSIGSLNLVTSTMAVMLVGMGIDFSVHIFARIREERKHGYDGPEATRRGIIGTGPAVLTGAATSAAAFFAMALTDFRATRELGMIASGGLLLVMAASFIVLPLVLGRPGTRAGAPTTRVRTLVWPRKLNWLFVAGCLAFTAWIGSRIEPLDFNFDITTYLPAGAPSIAAVKRLEEKGVGGLHYAVTQSTTMEESRRQARAIERLAEPGPGRLVSRVESIWDVLPPDLDKKDGIVRQIRRLAKELPRIEFKAAPDASVAKFANDLDGLIERIEQDLPYTLKTLGRGELGKKAARTLPALKKLAKTVRGLDEATLRARLTRFEDLVATVSLRIDAFFHAEHKKLTAAELPTDLVSAFYQPADADHPEPAYAVRVYPEGGANDPYLTRTLTRALRGIDSRATGTAITHGHFGMLIKDGLWTAARWATLFVILLVLVDLRRPRDVLLALLPLMMGCVWMVGMLNVLRIDYTFANVLCIPLIMGIGVDSGVHVVHRFRETGDVGLSIATTGKAIVVSSMTTAAAFGALMLADNGAAKTMGATLLLGVTACLITSLVFLPALLDLLAQRQAAKAAKG